MENIQERINSAKKTYRLFNVFKIIGIILIPLGFLLVFIEFFNYLEEIIYYANQGSIEGIWDAFFKYVISVSAQSFVMYIGIALIIVFSILCSKKKKLFTSLEKELADSQVEELETPVEVVE